MHKKSRKKVSEQPAAAPDPQREREAAKKLSRPPKDKTEVTIGPGPAGPDVLIE